MIHQKQTDPKLIYVDLESQECLNSSYFLMFEIGMLIVRSAERKDISQIDANQWRIQNLPEGAPNPKVEGPNPLICPFVPENCMKLKII